MAEMLFHGAAGEVTGSMHMVRADGRWVALDCGLFQGRREESEAKNREWPVRPAEVSAVVLSHAHADHAARLPKLVKDGFEGPIFCTPATRDLCAIMLRDSAHIQLEDVFYLNKRRRKKGLPPVEALYEDQHAVQALRQMQTVSYGTWFPPAPGLLVQFREAGHILGSAGVHLIFGKRNGSAPSVYFTGDVGRPNKPIIRDPAPFPACDAIICESTYGGRVNEDPQNARARLIDVVNKTHERGGKVIIPAFSVGRTQSVIYFLQQAMLTKELPRIPVFVDSPLAVDATQVFKMHPECYDEDAREFDRKAGELFGAQCCTYIRDVEESKRLHKRRNPCVIISASGMCEAGRIRHHIKNNIENPANTILLAGYQAMNTLGRRLQDGAERINLFHESYQVRAEVAQIHGFSAHADQAELLALLTPLRADAKKVFLVHGEPEQSGALQEKLRGLGFARVELAAPGLQATV